MEKLSIKSAIGKTGVEIPPIIFGTSALGNLYKVLPEEQKLQILVDHRERGSGVIKELARGEGMITLWEDGSEKVKKGVTTLEEVAKVTREEGAGI